MSNRVREFTMVESPGYLRVRHLVASSGGQLAVLLVVVAIVLGGVGVLFAPPAYSEETEQTDREIIRATLDTSGVVENETPPYAVGDELENLPVYITEAVPTLTVGGGATVPDGSDVTVTHRIVYEASQRGEPAPFWTEEVRLQRVSTVAESGEVDIESQFEPVSVRSQLAAYQQAFGPEIIVRGSFQTVVEYDTGVHQGELVAESPIAFTSNTYELPTVTESRVETNTATVSKLDTETAFSIRGIAITQHEAFFGALSLLAVIGAAGAVLGQRRLDPEKTAEQLQYLRYSEWISSGEIIRYGQWHTVYKAESLEDLIDIAIDTDERVLYDKATSTYFVVSGLALYVCPSSEASDGILDWFSWY